MGTIQAVTCPDRTQLLPSGYSLSPSAQLKLKLASVAHQVRAAGGEVRASRDWLYLDFGSDGPPQGWKIHLSASIVNFADIMMKSVYYLISQRVAFKCIRRITSLTGYEGSYTQLAKFITIYPASETKFVECALYLAQHLSGIASPSVAGDMRIGSSPVHYRYGVISGWADLPRGLARETTLRDASGQPTPDRKGQLPAFVSDPLAGHRSPKKSSVLKVLDRPEFSWHQRLLTGHSLILIGEHIGRPAVAKIVRKGVYDGWGQEWTALLRRGRDTMLALWRRAPVPRFIAWIEDESDAAMVTEALPGFALDAWMRRAAWTGKTITDELRWSVTSKILELVGCIHREGFIIGDLSPSNLVIDVNKGAVALTDLDLATRMGGPIAYGGTIGFSLGTPYRYNNPTSKDLLALASCCFFLQTGEPLWSGHAEISWIRRLNSFGARVEPEVYRRLASIIVDLVRQASVVDGPC